MEPKRNAPKLIAIICIVAIVVAIYCSCFVPKDNFGDAPIVSPKSNTLIALPKTSFEPGTPDTPSELPAPPVPSSFSTESSCTVEFLNVALPNEEPSIEAQLAGARDWDDEEVMDYFEEVTPSLEYTCPYDIHKCVASMQFTLKELSVTWDIYLYSRDGIIGTWLVNNAGNSLSFYGSAFAYGIDNYNIHLGEYYQLSDGRSVVLKYTCVYPEQTPDPNSFMIVHYREEIDKIS